MQKSVEELIRDRISRLTGKEFQQLVWDILICHYPSLQTPKMLHDLGSDGHDFTNRIFFAVYAPERYNPSETCNKISNPEYKKKKDMGDYEKFTDQWSLTGQFDRWYFITKENLTGKPLKAIAELNNNGDGIVKMNIGLENLVQFALGLEEKDLQRIFNLPSKQSISSEVETIMDLICYISANSELTPEGFKNNVPDPDKKLKRFAKYCSQIKREIINSWMYAKAQKEAENVLGVDVITIGKIVGYLNEMSTRFLDENANDPMIALNKLTDFLESELGKNNKEYSHTAIRYYLIAEIPKCNVFPNDNS